MAEGLTTYDKISNRVGQHETFGPVNRKAKFGNLFSRKNSAEERDKAISRLNQEIQNGSGLQVVNRFNRFGKTFVRGAIGGHEAARLRIKNEYSDQYIGSRLFRKRDSYLYRAGDTLAAIGDARKSSIIDSLSVVNGSSAPFHSASKNRLGEISTTYRYLSQYEDAVEARKLMMLEEGQKLINKKQELENLIKTNPSTENKVHLERITKNLESVEENTKAVLEEAAYVKRILPDLNKEQSNLLFEGIGKISKFELQVEDNLKKQNDVLIKLKKDPVKNAEPIKALEKEIEQGENYLKNSIVEKEEIKQILTLSSKAEDYLKGRIPVGSPKSKEFAKDFIDFLEKKEQKDSTSLLPLETSLLKEYRENQTNPSTQANPITPSLEGKILSEANNLMTTNRMIKGQELDGVGIGVVQNRTEALDMAQKVLLESKDVLDQGYAAGKNVSKERCDALADSCTRVKGLEFAIKNLKNAKKPDDQQVALGQLYASIYSVKHGEDKDLYNTPEAKKLGITPQNIIDPEKALAFNMLKGKIIKEEIEKEQIAKHGKSPFIASDANIPKKKIPVMDPPSISVEVDLASSSKQSAVDNTVSVEVTANRDKLTQERSKPKSSSKLVG